MVEDNWFKIGVLVFLLALTCIGIYGVIVETKEPSIVSPDSIIDMSCNELHVNYNRCVLDSNPEAWDYCAEVYLPLYYEKCR